MFYARLREGASLGTGLAGFYLVAIAGGFVVAAALPEPPVSGLRLLFDSLPLLGGAGIAYGLLFRVGQGRWTPAEIGWRGGFRAKLGNFGRGAALGAAMAVAAIAVSVGTGGSSVRLTSGSILLYLSVLAQQGTGLLAAALTEEFLFRGFPLVRLSRNIGRVWASAVLAVVFAAAHLWNPDVSLLGLLNIGLASLVLSAAFFTPGGLMAAWGLHFGWNSGLGLGFDAPVSGLSFGVPLVDYDPGSKLVTGGAFGPEGGVAGSLVMIVGLMWIVQTVKRSEENE